jgi:hypothetical protein
MIQWFIRLSDAMLQDAWVAVLVYYAIKFAAQFFILYNTSLERCGGNVLFQQLGADLSFMSLTLLGRAISDPNSFVSQATAPLVLIFLLSVFFLAAFILSYFLYRKQVQLKERTNKTINFLTRSYTGEKHVSMACYGLVVCSWILGILSFVLSTNLFK